MMRPRIQARIVLQGMLGSSVFATADRTSGYGESSSRSPRFLRSMFASRKYAPVTFSTNSSIARRVLFRALPQREPKLRESRTRYQNRDSPFTGGLLASLSVFSRDGLRLLTSSDILARGTVSSLPTIVTEPLYQRPKGTNYFTQDRAGAIRWTDGYESDLAAR